MPEKDFYKILDVPQQASTEEIKKAYRKLALKYHPDVNPGGKATEHWFRQIHEAYRILSNPDLRSAYNQQRWYRESVVSNKREPPQTPEELLLKCIALGRYIVSIDAQRINFEALQQYLLYLLALQNLQMLSEWKDRDTNLLIVEELLKASDPLSYKRFCPVAQQLIQIDTGMGSNINLVLKQKKQQGYWQNYQVLFVLLVSVFLCLLIYLLAG